LFGARPALPDASFWPQIEAARPRETIDKQKIFVAKCRVTEGVIRSRQGITTGNPGFLAEKVSWVRGAGRDVGLVSNGNFWTTSMVEDAREALKRLSEE
jgi:hypothetical protein